MPRPTLSFALLSFVCTVAAAQSTYYVATCGNDADVGLSPVCGAGGGPFASVQAAVAAASAGDLIVVLPGAYAGNIDLLGKDLRIVSAQGAASTTLVGTGLGPVVRCVSGEPPTTLVRGFSITGGGGDPLWTGMLVGGGAFVGAGAAPQFEDCRFFANYTQTGGAVYTDGSPSFRRCTFDSNFASLWCGAFVSNGNPILIEDCEFVGNAAGLSGGCLCVQGPGEVVRTRFSANSAPANSAVESQGTAVLRDCVIESNTGLYAVAYTSLGGVIENCTIVGNASTGPAISGGNLAVRSSIVRANAGGSFALTGASTVAYCDVQGGFAGVGNFDLDPAFAAPGDYRLQSGSPCVEAGDPARAGGGLLDAFRAARFVDADGDGVLRVDVGAFEFAPVSLTATSSPLPGGAKALSASVSGAPTALVAFFAAPPAATPYLVAPFGPVFVDLSGPYLLLVGSPPFTVGGVVPPGVLLPPTTLQALALTGNTWSVSGPIDASAL